MSDTSTQALIGGIVIGLFVGAGGTWLYLDRGAFFTDDERRSDESAKDRRAERGASGTTPPPGPTDIGVSATGAFASSLHAAAQEAGSAVLLTSVTIETLGWAVVYESRSGQPGNALGAARLDAGSYASVSVPLLRATVPGQSYFAVLHRDDGDKAFELRDDFPLRDEGGAPIMVSFETTPVGASQ